MCYEDADYQAEQQAEAEAEAQAHQEEAYAYYLDSLLKDGLFNVYAVHFAIDQLSTSDFFESGLSAKSFFAKKLEDFQKKVEGDVKTSDLPF